MRNPLGSTQNVSRCLQMPLIAHFSTFFIAGLIAIACQRNAPAQRDEIFSSYQRDRMVTQLFPSFFRGYNGAAILVQHLTVHEDSGSQANEAESLLVTLAPLANRFGDSMIVVQQIVGGRDLAGRPGSVRFFPFRLVPAGEWQGGF